MKKNVLLPLIFLAISPCFGATPAAPTMPDSLPLHTDNQCSMAMSNSTVDFGSQSRWQLQDVAGSAQSVSPGKRQLAVTIQCPYTQSIRLVARGERQPNGNFRYGDKGYLKATLQDMSVDGQTVQLVATTPDGIAQGSTGSAIEVKPNQSFTPVINGRAVEGKVFTARLEIEPIIPESDARVTNRSSTESLFSLELVH